MERQLAGITTSLVLGCANPHPGREPRAGDCSNGRPGGQATEGQRQSPVALAHAEMHEALERVDRQASLRSTWARRASKGQSAHRGCVGWCDGDRRRRGSMRSIAGCTWQPGCRAAEPRRHRASRRSNLNSAGLASGRSFNIAETVLGSREGKLLLVEKLVTIAGGHRVTREVGDSNDRA